LVTLHTCRSDRGHEAIGLRTPRQDLLLAVVSDLAAKQKYVFKTEKHLPALFREHKFIRVIEGLGSVLCMYFIHQMLAICSMYLSFGLLKA
jgi:hypothetical protein